MPDYLRCVTRLREVLGPWVIDLLGGGMLLTVLDWPANTREARYWLSET